MENELNIEPFDRAERLPSSLPWAVYRAWDKKSGHMARLAVLWAGEQMPVERVRGGLDWFAEAGYQAQRLTSPAVPGVLSYRSAGDHAYVATDFPDGMPVRDWVAAHGPLPVARAMQASSTIASVLAQAHAAGWAHGWINPDTVWISDGGVVTVNDLGLGLSAQPLLPGAAPFSAPPGFISTDPMRRDMQCLGLLLTLMLTGRLPDPVGVPRGDIFPDEVPGGVVRRIRALISPQTEHPPGAAEWAEFARVGDGGVYSEPPDAGRAAPDTGYYDAALPPADGHHRGTTVAGIALVLVALAVTWFFYSHGPDIPAEPASNVPGASAGVTPPQPDTYTKVRVGPIAPGELEETTHKLTRMGFEPFTWRDGGRVYLQVGAFANKDGAHQAESELKAAGLPVVVQ